MARLNVMPHATHRIDRHIDTYSLTLSVCGLFNRTSTAYIYTSNEQSLDPVSIIVRRQPLTSRDRSSRRTLEAHASTRPWHGLLDHVSSEHFAGRAKQLLKLPTTDTIHV